MAVLRHENLAAYILSIAALCIWIIIQLEDSVSVSVIGILIIRDEKTADTCILRLQNLISGVVGIGTYGSVRPLHLNQAVQRIILVAGFPSTPVCQPGNIVILIVLIGTPVFCPNR